jgi:F-type H+-transporting ATPase subunit gamma
MPSLKDLKNRIVSVKSTRKITSAMKMVAASKLRRAQEQAEAARPYAQAMARMLQSLSANLVLDSDSSPLIAGTGKQDTVLLLVITSDRGLCGGFNGTVVREARKQIKSLQQEGKQVRLYCVGRKGRDLLKRDYASLMLTAMDDAGKKKLDYADAEKIVAQLLALLAEGKFDVCRMVYNRFKSVIAQVVTTAQIIPLEPAAANENARNEGAQALMLFEPDEEAILNQLLPQNLAVQVYGALLESLAGEMGARMTAMDNATRNAGDMINRLTLQYNRSRQAYITKELIEIISGAEAV